MEGGLAKGARGDPREGIMVSLPAFDDTMAIKDHGEWKS
jgi:hypothetical protein